MLGPLSSIAGAMRNALFLLRCCSVSIPHTHTYTGAHWTHQCTNVLSCSQICELCAMRKLLHTQTHTPSNCAQCCCTKGVQVKRHRSFSLKNAPASGSLTMRTTTNFAIFPAPSLLSAATTLLFWPPPPVTAVVFVWLAAACAAKLELEH